MEIKSPNKENFPKILDFLKENLRPEHQWNISQEYPIAFSPYNMNKIRVIEEGGEIVSHGLTKHIVCKTPAGLFKIAVIGSIVTNKKFQNQGYANLLVKDLLSEAQKDRCDIALLWSNLDGFYRKLGFELCGQENFVTFKKKHPAFNSPIDQTLQFFKNKKIDPEALLRVYSNHLVGSIRTANEISAYQDIPNSNIFSLWSKKNELLAYAVEGRGADLGEIIHEWGGNVSHLVQLFNHILETKHEIKLMTSVTAKNLIKNLDKNFDLQCTKRTLGYLKIVCPENIHSKIQRWARSQKVYHLSTKNSGEQVLISYKGESFTLDNTQIFCQLIWGPIIAGNIDGISDEFNSALSKVFPLPLWVWGWDAA